MRVHARRPLGVVAAVLLLTGLAGVTGSANAGEPGSTPTGAPHRLLPSATVKGDDLIRLLAGAFDPLKATLPVPAGIARVDEARLPVGEPAPWIVQVRGADFADATDAITGTGATIQSFLPDTAYLVRATPVQRLALAASPSIRWTGLLQPGWKVPGAVLGLPGLLDVAGPQTYSVYALTGQAPDLVTDGALRALPGLAGKVGRATGPVWQVTADRSVLPAIAGLPGVVWIEAKARHQLLNANARWVNDTGVRDLYDATLPGRLTGAGQVAGVADTAPNYTTSANGTAHAAFRDCPTPATCKVADYTQKTAGTDDLETVVDNRAADGKPAHRKEVAFFDLGEAGPNPPDADSHGTHVSGSVAGDTGGDGTWEGDDGLAPAARLVNQGIGTTDGGLVTPDSYYDLFRQAYRPADPASVPSSHDVTDYAKYDHTKDARTHNNSYGSSLQIDIGEAAAADQFVWDHEDMVIISSAGNDGPGPMTLGSPTIGRNVVTSGASAGGRQPGASIDSMAIFSTHGPDNAGAYGIDLVTPGQIVVGPKGGTDHDVQVLQGTSMSGPVLTGLATLTRQYFFDGYGPSAGGGDHARGFADGTTSGTGSGTNPSAALVRATLVNGATRMRGIYTGDDGTDRTQDGQYPSAGQGFGQVNLRDSLYFDDAQGKSRQSAYFADVWRDDTDAFATTDPITNPNRDVQLHVEPGQPLQATLAFSDAPTGLPAGTPLPVNDLDLQVIDPSGGIHAGNDFATRDDVTLAEAEVPAGGSADTLNPVEKVRIANPAAGTWTIRVRATKVPMGKQGYGLAVTGRISATTGPTFTPGAPAQVDAPGAPAVSDVVVTPVDGGTAQVTFTTSEPTKALVRSGATGSTVDHIDSYNLGPDGYPGIVGDKAETSAAFADRPVVGTHHEVTLTGLATDAPVPLAIQVTDLAGQVVTVPSTVTTPSRVVGVAPGDEALLYSDASAGGFGTSTQLYVGKSSGADLLGALLFRVPAGVDPARVTGASVELTSMHDLTSHYTDPAAVAVDLLAPTVEPGFTTLAYAGVAQAASASRLQGQSTLRAGGYQRYSFALDCAHLGALRDTLTTEGADGTRQAAFRVTSNTTLDESLFSFETGFNRRTKGIGLRPKLVLQLDGAADPRPCDAAAPAPAISDVGVSFLPIAGGRRPVSVTWRTDRDADAAVLFRPKGTTAWNQVSEAGRSTVHALTVLLPAGADPAAYEVAVRSAGCNGAASTDDDGGTGYTFSPTTPAVGTGAQVAPFPPTTAGSSGLGIAAVPTRTVPTAADVDAGTAVCASSGTFVPLTPARLLDTRDGTGAAAVGPVSGGRPIDLQVTGRGGVPATGIAAVVLNLTAVDLKGAAASFVTAYPTGTTLPTASNLNVVPGPAVPNLVTVRVGSEGKVSLYDQLGTVHLVADVAGYYEDAGAPTPGTTFVPVTPSRVLDTRDGTDTPKAKVAAGKTVDLSIAGHGGVPATGVKAVVLNLTATGLAGAGATFVTAYPADAARPLASNVNVAGTQPVPNLVTVAVSPTGVVRLYNFQGNVDLVADVTGYYTDAGTGARFVPVDPTRLLDTRIGNGAPQAKVGPGGTVTTDLAGRLGVPSAGVIGVVVNLTGVSPSAQTFLTAYPAGGARPNASNLNLLKGQTDPNLVVLGLGNLAASIYNQTSTVDLVADVAGVFVR